MYEGVGESCWWQRTRRGECLGILVGWPGRLASEGGGYSAAALGRHTHEEKGEAGLVLLLAWTRIIFHQHPRPLPR